MNSLTFCTGSNPATKRRFEIRQLPEGGFGIYITGPDGSLFSETILPGAGFVTAFELARKLIGGPV